MISVGILLTVTVITVLLIAYFLPSPTLIVIFAVPFFKAVTVPFSETLIMPDSSGTKVTFKLAGLVVYSIVPFSPTFNSMF